VSTNPGSINHCNGNGSLIARSYAYSSPVPCLSVEGPLRGPLNLCFSPITANNPYDSYTKQMASSRQRSLRFLLRYPRRKPPSRYKILLARAAAISFPLHAAVHAVSRRRIIECCLEHNKYSGHISLLARSHEQLRSRYLEAHSTIPVSDLAIPANDMFPCFHRRGLSEVIRHMVRVGFFRWHHNHHLLFKCAKDTALFQCSTTL
jgi:hypothetical protein